MDKKFLLNEKNIFKETDDLPVLIRNELIGNEKLIGNEELIGNDELLENWVVDFYEEINIPVKETDFVYRVNGKEFPEIKVTKLPDIGDAPIYVYF